MAYMPQSDGSYYDPASGKFWRNGVWTTQAAPARAGSTGKRTAEGYDVMADGSYYDPMSGKYWRNGVWGDSPGAAQAVAPEPRAAGAPTATGQPVLQAPLPASANAGAAPAAGRTNLLMTGQQILDAINARVASGQPIDEAFSINLWKQAGLNDAQARQMHQYGANFYSRNGKPMSAQDIDGVLGQFSQGLSPTLDAGSIGASSGPISSSNSFMNGLSLADLLDTVRRDKGDLSNVAQTMVSNKEGASGRYNPANRDMFMQAADDMKGLFALDSVADNSITDTASRLGDYYGQRTAGGTTQYDSNQSGRLNTALSSLEGNPNSATNSAFLSDPTAQVLAARTGLQRSVNPLLASTVGNRVNEEAAKYNTINTSRGPDKGGFLRFLKNSGMF